MNYTVEKITEDRKWYKFTNINAKGEKNYYRNSENNMWFKK